MIVWPVTEIRQTGTFKNHREGQNEWPSHPDEFLEVESPFWHKKLADRQKDHFFIMIVENAPKYSPD